MGEWNLFIFWLKRCKECTAVRYAVIAIPKSIDWRRERAQSGYGRVFIRVGINLKKKVDAQADSKYLALDYAQS